MNAALDLASPEFYPLQVDLERRAVGLLRLSESAYAEAGFLDERLLETVPDIVWTDWPTLEAAARAVDGESDFIFHIGHVGSTLLARLLGRHHRVFALREPAILRSVANLRAETGFSDALSIMLKLYARVWRPGQRSLVKATSFVADLGSEALECFPSARATLMVSAPQVFIATLLAGEGSRAELPMVTPVRIGRLSRRLGEPLFSAVASEGEMAAAGWACEMCVLADMAARYPDRVLWLDFDRLLADLPSGLLKVARHLDLGFSAADVAVMLSGPELGQYSKAPERAFDAGRRHEVIGEAMHCHGQEIQRGLAWLDAAAGAHPAIARASQVAAAAGRAFSLDRQMGRD
ncbi:MAG: hypothetical protein ACREEB_15825 [Caulobacteraceae bacterium]